MELKQQSEELTTQYILANELQGLQTGVDPLYYVHDGAYLIAVDQSLVVLDSQESEKLNISNAGAMLLLGNVDSQDHSESMVVEEHNEDSGFEEKSMVNKGKSSNLNVNQVTGRNLLTGQIITLDKRIEKAYANPITQSCVVSKPELRVDKKKLLVSKIVQIKQQKDSIPINNELLEQVKRIIADVMDATKGQLELNKDDLLVRIVEKKHIPENNSYIKFVSFVCGRLEVSSTGWEFEIDKDKTARVDVTNIYEKKNFDLTIYITQGNQTIRLNLNDKNRKEKSSVTQNFSSILKWYQCPTCAKSFSSAGNLKRHMTVHNPSMRPLECHTCLQRFTDDSTLRKHLLIHANTREFMCEVCGKSFINRGDLNCHIRIHDPEKHGNCPICGRKFSRYSNLMRHFQIHGIGKETHRCDICGCTYSFASSLTRHVVQCHVSIR